MGTELGPATYVSDRLGTGIDNVYSAVNVIAARRGELLEKTAAEIAEAGGRCDTAVLDIRDEQAVDAVNRLRNES